MGQPSKIDRLPKEVREALNSWLLDPAITQLEATSRTNVLLDEIGHPERMDKSSVNRYAQKMEEVGAKIRQSREMAEMWIGRFGAAPQGQVGLLITETLRTMAYELTLKLQEADLTDAATMAATIDQLKALSLAVQRLEASTTLNVKRETEIRTQERERLKEETLKAVDAAGAGGKMSAAALKEAIKKVYGV